MSTIEIYEKIWELSPRVAVADTCAKLNDLTNSLIRNYELQGKLETNPFDPTRMRQLSMPVEKINDLLKGSTCLVSGGLGCVGTELVKELLKLDVAYVVVLDIRPAPPVRDGRIIQVCCDIRNSNELNKVFSFHQPEFVFHLAAQRDPGRSEAEVEDSVHTNVLGTLNMVNACESCANVVQMIFSSTGKASRYFTREVYAASKKLCEFILDTRARHSRIRYGMVRFTHILENSLMNMELERSSRKNHYLAIHSPGKYVTAQNANEAARLLMNALIHTREKECCFLTVKHLEWPVESLEIALYYIKKSGRSIPIVFSGNPAGYSEKYFHGQIDWSRPTGLNPLINVYEGKNYFVNDADDIIIADICRVDEDILENTLERIRSVKGDDAMRLALVGGLKSLVNSSLKYVDKKTTVEIIYLGLGPLPTGDVSDFDPIVPMLMASLVGSDHYTSVEDLIYQKI